MPFPTKRWRRRLLGPALVAAILGLAWLGLRETAYSSRLPTALKERMPGHWRVPWGMASGARDAVEDLYSPERPHRARAALTLGDCGPDAAPAARFLVPLLADDPQPKPEEKSPPPAPTFIQRAWKYVVLFLGPTPKPRERIYFTDSPSAAMSALIDIGPRAVDPLIGALADPYAPVRGRAAWCLGQIGDARAAPALIRLLADDPYPLVRMAAAMALGHLADGRAVEPLLAALAHKDYQTRFAAVTALGRLGQAGAVAPADQARVAEAVADALQDDASDNARCATAGALLGLGEPGTRALLARQYRVNGNGLGFGLVLAIVRDGARPTDPRLTRVLLDQLSRGLDDPETPMAVALARPPEAFDSLARALSDRGRSVDARRAAADALMRLGDERTTAALVAALDGATDDLAAAIASRLRYFDSVESRQALIGRLGHPSLSVCSAALEALAGRGDVSRADLIGYARPTVDRALPLLGTADRKTQMAAAGFLGRTGDPRAMEPLVTALQTNLDIYVRGAAAKALGRLGDPRAVEPLLKILASSAGNISAGLSAYTMVPAPLETPERDCIAALGRLKDPEAVKAMAAALSRIPLPPHGREYEAGSLADALLENGDMRGLVPWFAVADICPAYLPSEDRGSAAVRIARLGPKAVGPLVAELESEIARGYDPEFSPAMAAAALLLIDDAEAQRAAETALVQSTPERLRQTIGALQDAAAADPDLVRRALDRLARQSRDRTARTLAICTLARLAEPVDPKSLDAVRRLAAADRSASVRLAAARGLLHLSDPRNRNGTPDMFSLLFAADAFPDEPPAKVPWTPDPEKP